MNYDWKNMKLDRKCHQICLPHSCIDSKSDSESLGGPANFGQDSLFLEKFGS